MAAEPRIRHALNQAAGMIFPRGWDSRLVGRARYPGRPFQSLAHASGPSSATLCLRCGNCALACRPRYLPESSHRATPAKGCLNTAGKARRHRVASLASHNTLWNHAALSLLKDSRVELSPAKCHQAIGRVN